jgi:hypothetical protein
MPHGRCRRRAEVTQHELAAAICRGRARPRHCLIHPPRCVSQWPRPVAQGYPIARADARAAGASGARPGRRPRRHRCEHVPRQGAIDLHLFDRLRDEPLPIVAGEDHGDARCGRLPIDHDVQLRKIQCRTRTKLAYFGGAHKSEHVESPVGIPRYSRTRKSRVSSPWSAALHAEGPVARLDCLAVKRPDFPHGRTVGRRIPARQIRRTYLTTATFVLERTPPAARSLAK